MAMKHIVSLLLLAIALSTGVALALSVVPVHLWLAYDVATGKQISAGGVYDSAWQQALSLIGPGSTLKPFLLSAALTGGLDPDRTMICPWAPPATPADKRCWFANGHGPLDFTGALAQSCSVYTRQACRYVDADRYRKLLVDFGLGAHLPDEVTFRDLGCEAWMGAKPGIAVTPEELAQAYIRAFGKADVQPSLPGRERIVPGLIACCTEGTGKAVRQVSPALKVMGKTGTGTDREGRQCGIFIGLVPYDAPRLAIVYVVANASGGQAAFMAGQRLPDLMKALDQPSP